MYAKNIRQCVDRDVKILWCAKRNNRIARSGRAQICERSKVRATKIAIFWHWMNTSLSFISVEKHLAFAFSVLFHVQRVILPILDSSGQWTMCHPIHSDLWNMFKNSLRNVNINTADKHSTRLLAVFDPARQGPACTH